jgi:hypothetical protein
MGTTATFAGMAAAVGKPRPPGVELALSLGVPLSEGFAVLLLETE